MSQTMMTSPVELMSGVLQDSLVNSAGTIKAAVEGQAGVLVKGSRTVSPEGRSSDDNDDGNGLGAGESPPLRQLRFRGLEPRKRYVISLCTESNSGTLSRVIVAEAEPHAEAPLVRPVCYSARKQQRISVSRVLARSLAGGKTRDTSRFSFH